ncbi:MULTISPECIES: hypothetical protein [Vibrio]|uniref:Fimbrial biogenesis outer membrane usher protein n=1 Tax=Vibrio cholerae TaxID=666 RepID=A0A8B5ZLI2_VIBCL|nr:MULTISPECIES: hypothetical protein [Vibrio]TXY93634.1 hypothetical protein FXE67_03770 [Vibrio cholerae]TXZ10953.1 hypothetical protein FXE57_10410 [Vibrio cholerae]TYA67694.1 hypothetical protein FXE28_00500 [Vibrio cholerae]BCK22236.1 hypothetical protein VCSRO51_2663 [Vibrio cholerae]GHZ17745.1 hypothetical protein VCSRO78_2545 [Vibrio cholerae]
MKKKLSHVKVFVPTVLLAAAFTLTASPTSADDYLMKFVLNGQNKGEYLVSREVDSAIAEPGLWHAAGVNTKEQLPLERLNNLGHAKIVWSEQTIYFYPRNNAAKARKVKPEVTIEPNVSNLDVKSFDYFLTYQSKGDIAGNITGTGRVANLDVDVRAGLGEQESYFSSQWHDEENSNVKDIEVGRVQRYGLDGFSLTNESSLATGSFSNDQIELYWPVGTRVDVYRDGTYLQSLVLDSEPFSYKIELNYSNNQYKFYAVLPDGRTDTKTIERAISGRLAPVGGLTYQVAVGKSPATDESKLIGRLSYGMTNELSLFAGQDEQERQYFSALYSRDDFSFEPIWYGSSGYALSGSWQDGNLAIFGKLSDLDNYHLRSVSVSSRSLFQPTIQYSSRTHGGYETQETTLRTYHSTRLETLNTSISLSPYYSNRLTNGVRSNIFGGRMLASMEAGWQVLASYEHESKDINGIRDIERFNGEISKRFSLGRLTYRYAASNFGHGWEGQQQSLRADLWNWKFATVSASFNHSSGGGNNITLSVSGSFGRTGFQRAPQRSQATLVLSTCRDLNADGICQEVEPEVKGVTASVDGRQVRTPAVIDSLTPYRRYDIEVSGDFGLSPQYDSIQSDRLVRGGINHLRLPLSEVREIEGQLERDGIRVALIDTETGDVLAEQTTEFGGWYLFYAPAGLKVKVVEEPELKPTKNFHM